MLIYCGNDPKPEHCPARMKEPVGFIDGYDMVPLMQLTAIGLCEVLMEGNWTTDHWLSDLSHWNYLNLQVAWNEAQHNAAWAACGSGNHKGEIMDLIARKHTKNYVNGGDKERTHRRRGMDFGRLPQRATRHHGIVQTPD